MRRRAALLFFVVFLSGCLGVGGGEPTVPDSETAVEGYDSLESLEATVQTLTTGERANTTARIVRQVDERRIRQRYLSPEHRAGNVLVINESTTWIYNASKDEATRISTSGLGNRNNSYSDFLRRLFGNISTQEESRAVVAPPRPIEPVVGDPESNGSTIAGLGSGQPVNVTYLGTETVAGRPTHQIGVRPVNQSAGGLAGDLRRLTYWIDAEYFFPLRTERTLVNDGSVTRNARVYRNVSFNVDPAPDTFRYDPPPNTTVRVQEPPARFESASAAAENVSFAVPEIDPPEGFDIDVARVFRRDNQTSVALPYSNRTDFLSVTARRPPSGDTGDGVEVSLGPVNATQVRSGDLTTVVWQCNGTEYVVSGELPADTIEATAREAVSVCSTGAERDAER